MISIIKGISFVFFLVSFIVGVKSQTCEITSPYSSCSSNSACGCLSLVFANNIGICGLTAVRCSRLSPCQSDDTCENADHICVHHPQCSSSPVCYPLSMTDPRLCPAMISTTIQATTSYFTTDQTTTRSYITSEVTTAEVNTTGYDSYNFTSDSFTPSGSIISNYSNELTTNNSKLPNSNKYYQAIEIFVNTSGYYDIRSLSTYDTYGCLYAGEYNPSSSANLIACNDDYINNQFRLAHLLEVNTTYILVFTTYGSDVIGLYTIIAVGPGEVEFNSIDAVQRESTPFYTTYATSTESSNNISVFSNYSSELTRYHDKYPGTNKYYEAIQIMVYTSGYYTLNSIENLDGYGYLYQSYFDSSNPEYNLLAQDDQSGGDNQFRLGAYLHAGVPYTLVFTTYGQSVTGSFIILASGPSEVEFNLLNSTIQPTMTTPSYSTLNCSNGSETYYSGLLSEYSSKYPTTNVYYEAIQITVNISGFYTFNSIESLGGHGFLYERVFYPTMNGYNLIAQDHQSGGDNQFRIQFYLQADMPYILVFTPYRENITGSFSIVACGPSEVGLTFLYYPPETTPITPSYSTSDYSNESKTYYSSALTKDSGKFSRNANFEPNFYYEAISINVIETGVYKIRSESNSNDTYMTTTSTYNFNDTQNYTSSNSMDTYGYIYQNSFNPRDISMNLIQQDDDSAGNGQFAFTLTLQAYVTYVLVATTYIPDRTGQFSIVASGPSYVTFSRINA